LAAFGDYAPELLAFFTERGGDYFRVSNKRGAVDFFRGMVMAAKAGHVKMLGLATVFFSYIASDFNVTASCFKPVPLVADVLDIDVEQVPPEEVTAHGAEEWKVTFHCALRSSEEVRFDVVWRVTYLSSLDKLVVQPDYQHLVLTQRGKPVTAKLDELRIPKPTAYDVPPPPPPRRRKHKRPEAAAGEDKELEEIDKELMRELGIGPEEVGVP
jgi:hypothetical protein